MLAARESLPLGLGERRTDAREQATTLRHIAKTLGKKLREELKGVGTEWEWTPLERGEVVEHLRICEAGPLPPKRKQVVVLPAVDRQREETSERGSVTSDASRTEARRIGRRKLAGAPLVVFKGKRAAVTAAAALKKKESQKKKRSRSRSESTSEKDETPNFEGACFARSFAEQVADPLLPAVIIHDDPHLSLVLNHYPPYLPPARIRPSSILRSSNSTSTFTSYLFFIPNLAGRLGVTLQSSVLRVPPTSVGILQGGKGSLVVRDSEVCWTMGRE